MKLIRKLFREILDFFLSKKKKNIKYKNCLQPIG